jgi:hypothetical protein
MDLRWEITLEIDSSEDLSSLLNEVEKLLLDMQAEKRLYVRAIRSRTGQYERRYNQ